jgi:peptidyl-prolyl cis-trans isomerase A (cyclophilin A)
MVSRALVPLVALIIGLALVVQAGPQLHAQSTGKAALMNPDDLKETAPATFKASFDTSAGPFVVEVIRDWAPNGADRFYNLVKRGYYDGSRFHRVIAGLAQFGIHGDPEVAQAWFNARIPDDVRKQSNTKGTIAFASSGVNRRSTQVFINLIDNPGMDVFNAPAGIVPFGRVVSGMNVVERLYNGYGEAAPTGKGPQMTPLYSEGTPYLEREFPKMDYIKKATVAS